MPPLDQPSAPVSYDWKLVAYVSALVFGSVYAVIHDPLRSTEWGSAIFLGAVALGVAYFSVSLVASIDVSWSTGTFLFLIAAFTTGLRGLAVVAVAHAIGFALRFRNGWFRTVFNASNHFIEGAVGLLVFREFPTEPILGGVLGGIADLVLSLMLLMGVVALATGRLDIRFWVGHGLRLVIYWATFGLAAAGAHLLYVAQGPLAYAEILGTPLALQGFLVLLARRIHLFDEETRAHQEARVRLLQQAIDASNTERERIAASIHDGVVQDLVGLTFTLGAYMGRDLESLSSDEKQLLLRQIAEGSETARKATHDLRTLMIEIASPKLKQAGLRAAVEDLLHNISGNVETELVMAPEIDDVSEAEQGLIYRVAQEGIRNAAKYSRARKLTVQVTKTPDDIVLLVVDDGKGFATEQRARRQQEGHVGLTLLERTVKDGGGRLEISSEPGHGTTLTMSIPTVG